jgi:predicted choloylglycine hydrolase
VTRKTFLARREDRPGDRWLADFAAGRAEAERWYLDGRRGAPASAAACRDALGRHMPELLDHYDRACALLGDDDLAHRIVSHWRPPAAAHGCTHAIWLGPGGPALVRNYDYPLDLVSPGILSSRWMGREIVAKAQRPWGGVTDGLNADGLAVSVALGGSVAVGEGFAVILVARYVLETCRTVREAIEALIRIPVAASHNVVLLDRSGDHATVYLGPKREAAVARGLACANSQERPGSASSERRLAAAQAALDEPCMALPGLVHRFLQPPLHSRKAAFPTVYTAVYRPAEGRVDYVWPGKVWPQAVGAFAPGDYAHDYGDLAP